MATPVVAECVNTMSSYDSIAEFYDLELASPFIGELEFWQHLLDTYGSPALELGSGTGRLTMPLCQAGHRLTGLELSPQMLAIAEGKKAELSTTEQDRLVFVHGDMAQFDLGAEFNVIFVPFNSFAMLLGRSEQESCLQNVRKHLVKGGRFAFTLPGLRRETECEGTEEFCWIKSDPARQRVVAKFVRMSLDLVRLIRTGERIYRVYSFHGSPEEIRAELRTRVLFQPELELLLDKNGFAIEHTYGDYRRSPYAEASRERIFVLQDTEKRMSSA